MTEKFKSDLQKLTRRTSELRQLYLEAIEEVYTLDAQHFDQKIENMVVAGAMGEY